MASLALLYTKIKASSDRSARLSPAQHASSGFLPRSVQVPAFYSAACKFRLSTAHRASSGFLLRNLQVPALYCAACKFRVSTMQRASSAQRASPGILLRSVQFPGFYCAACKFRPSSGFAPFSSFQEITLTIRSLENIVTSLLPPRHYHCTAGCESSNGCTAGGPASLHNRI